MDTINCMSPARRLSLLLRFGPALALVLWLAGCVRPGPNPPTFTMPGGATPGGATAGESTSPPAADPSLPLQTQLGTPAPDYNGQPTPDPAHYETSAGAATLGSHTVAVGETLGILAQRYGTTVEELMRLNGLTNPDLVQIGQALQVPGGEIQQVIGPDFKMVMLAPKTTPPTRLVSSLWMLPSLLLPEPTTPSKPLVSDVPQTSIKSVLL